MKARVEEPEAANEGKDEVEESEEEEEEERKFLEVEGFNSQLFVEKKIIRHMVWKWIFSFLVCVFFLDGTWATRGEGYNCWTTRKKNQTYQTPNIKETSGTV